MRHEKAKWSGGGVMFVVTTVRVTCYGRREGVPYLVLVLVLARFEFRWSQKNGGK